MKFAPGFNPFSFPRPSNSPFGGFGGMGQQFGGGIGPLAPFGKAISRQLNVKRQPEIQEFMGEVTDMANQRFEIDLGAVGQRPMFNQIARPAVIDLMEQQKLTLDTAQEPVTTSEEIQGYKDGGAAFPDLSGDGKITQKDILIGRGVIEKEEGGSIGLPMEQQLTQSNPNFVRIGGDIIDITDPSNPKVIFQGQKKRDIREIGGQLVDITDPSNPKVIFSSQEPSFTDPGGSPVLRPTDPTDLTYDAMIKRDVNQPSDRTRLGGFYQRQADKLRDLIPEVLMNKQMPQEEVNRLIELMPEPVQGMQEGGMAMPMPPQPAPPMPAPEQPPMPMQDQLDPNVVQSALAQAAGGIGDLDEAQNYEQVMNTMRGDQATVEERRQELAGVVGPGDAGQTPESVLTLVQPVMMLANVDQGIGQLAQQEMTQPMEGPMAGGIMSTVPEPPMMEAGGTAPVNFNRGGEVRPIQNFANGGNVGFGDIRLRQLGVNLADPSQTEPLILKIVNQAKNQEEAQPGTGKSLINSFFEKRRDLYRQIGLGDPKARAALAEDQKRMTKAQILFDIATTALAFAAPMEGERPGLSPAERLAMAARSTQLPEKIGARAQAQLQSEKEAAKEERAIDLAALQAAEGEATAAKAQAAAKELAALKSKTKDRVLRTIGNKIVDLTDPNKPVVVFEGDEERDIRSINNQLIDVTNPNDPKILFGKEDRKTQTVDGAIVDITDVDDVKVIYQSPKQNLKVVNNQVIDFTDITKPKLIYGEKPIKTVTVDNQVINITDPENPTVIYGEKPIKTATVGGQLLNITDPTKVEVLFGKPDTDIRTIGSEVVDLTDPNNPRVIYGEKERKTITLKGQVLDITDPDNVKVIFGEKDKDYKVIKGQLVEIQEDGQPKAIFGERTPDTGTFENMLLESGDMILVKKVGDKLYDTEGTVIDRASGKYKGALLISKDTAFDVSSTAKSQAKYRELLEEKQNARNDNDLRDQILNPQGNLVNVLPSEQGDRARTMTNTFNALKAARQGVGFWNKLKQAFSEVAGGIFPPLENVFEDEVAAGNFINAVNVLTRVALANSPRFAEGEQERLGTLLPSTDRLFANRENAVRKLIGIKKLLKQEELNVLEILTQETDKNILRENKRQMYAIKSALKLLETVPDVGFINSEEFENTMDILMKRRQERGEP